MSAGSPVSALLTSKINDTFKFTGALRDRLPSVCLSCALYTSVDADWPCCIDFRVKARGATRAVRLMGSAILLCHCYPVKR